MKFPRDLSLSFSRLMILGCLLFHISITIPVTGQTVDRFIAVSTRMILDDSVIQITFPTENKLRYDLQHTTSLSEEFQSLQVIEGNGQDALYNVVLELSQAFYRVALVRTDIEPDDPLTTIHGFVHDSNGKPVAGALVRIQGFPHHSGISREDGSFILPGVPTTSPMIELTAELENTNSSGSISDVKISPGGQTHAGIIVLKPSTTNSIRVIDLGGALSAKDAIRLIWVEPGSFVMGSPTSEFGRSLDENQYTVRLSQGYWLGETEVTQAQWQAVMGTNPSEFTGAADLPVEQVTWEDCVNFCERLTTSERLAGRLPENLVYALPTEAQWEYACRERGQSMTPFHFGIRLSPDQANFLSSQIRQTTKVGSYSPNASGFHDMHGNVNEWCQDVHDDYPSGAVIDPVGPPRDSPRIARGGSWVKRWELSRSASRLSYRPTSKFHTLGFRLSLQSPQVPNKENPRYSVTTILGSVADENGNPIQGASVQLRHWPVDAVESGADGSFAIPDVKVLVTRVGLTAEISGSNPAFGAASNVILVPDGQTDAGVIVIKPTSPDSMRVIDLGGRLSASDAIRLIWIEPGTFLMGLPPDDPGIIQGEFQQSVTLTQGYWLGETEVSQAQWRAVMTTNPSRYIEGDGLPVEEKSWEDCMKFCSRLTERERLAGRLPENMAYTLPTEAQWEFACRERGQSRTFFHFGNTLTTDQANFDRFIGKSVLVGSYTPNALGLYDMHGNVAEWCRDVYGDLPSGALIDPIGPGEGLSRVVRGGNWFSKSHVCRSDYRSGQQSSLTGFVTGFRLSLQSSVQTTTTAIP